MQTLPQIIREYLTQGKYTAVAKDMMAKYGLRIDQGGVLEREIMLLLMGIENPDEFSKALAEDAKLEQKTINGIVEDINEQIFVPLREQMRNGPETKQEPAKPVMTAPQPQPQSAAAQPPRPNWGSPNKPLAEVKPPQVQGGHPGLRNLLASITAEAQKSIESRKLLEDHEEPHIEFNKPPAVPRIVVPLPPPTRVSSSATANSQQPTPLNNPPGGLSGEHSAKQNVLAAKPYSTDPYREPIDEK